MPSRPAPSRPTMPRAKIAKLAKLTRWPVTISYFERQSESASSRRADAGLFHRLRALRERHFARAHARLSDFTISGEMTSLEIEEGKAVQVSAQMTVVPAPPSRRIDPRSRTTSERYSSSSARPLTTASRPNFSRSRSTACSACAARAVEQIGKIVAGGVLQVTDADADQAEARVAHFALEQFAPGGEDAGGELGRRAERLRARAQLEIGALELERHRRAGERIGFQPRRDALGQRPEMLFERPELGDVAVECGFRRNAFGLAARVRRRACRCRAPGARAARLPRRSGASGRARRRAADRRSGGSRRRRACPRSRRRRHR